MKSENSSRSTRLKRSRSPFKTWLRRLSQWIWLALFVWLFIQTDYHGNDTISQAVNIFFRIDPLVGAAAALASRTLIALVIPSIGFLISGIILGRWFCGWMCPLGTLLDSIHGFTRGSQTSPGNRRRQIRFVLLFAILTAAIFGLPLVGYFDPFALLIRGLTLAAYPAFNHSVQSLFTVTYQHAPDIVNSVTEPVYSALKSTILPFQTSIFKGALLSALILLTIFLLEKWERRFFCRNICPLGALYGLMARLGPFRGAGGDERCGSCRLCQTICRMGAIDSDRKISMSDCNLCLDCVDKCPKNMISFRWTARERPEQPIGTGVTRRAFLSATVAGIALPAVQGIDAATALKDPRLIRPPGACPEPEFLAKCIRCGECMKVCIGNALHPLFLEQGVKGMFSPVLIPRLGYCEFNCTLCGQVCPTGAIQVLKLEQKQKWSIGSAQFDTDRCLPYRGVNCMVCEEHCPVPDKAIRFKEAVVTNAREQKVRVRQPYVVGEKCIGCGICEHTCPLPGPAAIHVSFLGEKRHPLHADPALVDDDMAIIVDDEPEKTPADYPDYGENSDLSDTNPYGGSAGAGHYSDGFSLDQLNID